MTQYEELARLGVATVHEAQGKTGLVDLRLVQVVPGSRVAGRARTAMRLETPLAPVRYRTARSATSFW